MAIQLRDYQEDTLAKTELYLIKKDGVSGIEHLATGLGKTVITTHIIDRYFNPNKGIRTLIVGGQNNVLTYQMHENLCKHFPYMKGNILWGGKAVKASGIVMNRLDDTEARVLVASIQSLANSNELSAAMQPLEMLPIEKSDIIADKYGRVVISPRSKRRWLVSPRMDRVIAAGGTFDLWIHDEAHHALADGSVLLIQRLQQIRKLLNLPHMKIIGNTATPARADGRGLHTLFETIFVSYDFKWAQRHGFLVPFADPLRILVDTVEGEEGTEVIDSKTTIRYVNNWAEILVKGWLEKGQGRPTFAYVSQHNGASHVEDSKELCRTFQRFGVRAVHVDGTGCIDEKGNEVSKKEQGRLLQMLAKGQLDVITNVSVLIEGVDIPNASCVLLAKRIDSDNPTLLTQIIGRILRPAQGKEDALILEATGQALVMNGIAELGGFKVDPTTGRYLEDIDVEAVLAEFIRLWQEEPAKVNEWREQQQRFAQDTVAEAMNLALKGDKEALLSVHMKVLNDIIEFYHDEDKLMDGIDLRDLKVMGRIVGKNQTYELLKILPKSKAAWFADHENALMSLGVADGVSFVLHPPNHTRAGLAGQAKEILVAALADGDCDHDLVAGKSPEQLQKMLDFMEKASELFSNFTLWWVDTSKPWEPQIPAKFNGFWVHADEGLDTLESYAFSFAREDEDLKDIFEPKFASKKGRSSWKNQPPTEAQVKMYRNLCKGKVSAESESWSKGEMSMRINHAASMKPVETVVSKFETQVDKLKGIL